jgi:hypothetical protein
MVPRSKSDFGRVLAGTLHNSIRFDAKICELHLEDAAHAVLQAKAPADLLVLLLGDGCWERM